jgi:hypothetical protein
MFVKLKRTSTVVTNHGQLIMDTIVGLLTGTIAGVNDLGVIWDKTQCLFEAGSYPALSTPWTVLYTAASASAPVRILSHPSTISGKTNYLAIVGASYNQVYLGSGAAFATNTVLYPSSPAYYMFNAESANQTFYIRFADSFVHIYSTMVYSANIYNAAAVDFNLNPYDEYSEEASLKILSLNYAVAGFTPQLLVSKGYLPETDSYVATKGINLCYNLDSIARTASIGVSKAENLYDNTHLLVPLVFNDFSTGWLGGNISEICGIYMSTSSGFSTDQTVTIGSDVYHVFSNSTWPAVMLAKK